MLQLYIVKAVIIQISEFGIQMVKFGRPSNGLVAHEYRTLQSLGFLPLAFRR